MTTQTLTRNRYRPRGTRHANPRRERLRSAAEWAAVVAVGILLVFGYTALLSDTEDPQPPATRDVLVSAGDTLWSMAASNPVEGAPTAQTADLIRELNGLEPGPLPAGIRLVVPARPSDATAVAAR